MVSVYAVIKVREQDDEGERGERKTDKQTEGERWI